MQIDITLKNYRCFPDSKPARISLREGFTALVGVNNSRIHGLELCSAHIRSAWHVRPPNGSTHYGAWGEGESEVTPYVKRPRDS